MLTNLGIAISKGIVECSKAMGSPELLGDFNGLAKNLQGLFYSAGFRESDASVLGCYSKGNKSEPPLEGFNNSFRQLNGCCRLAKPSFLLTLELSEQQISARVFPLAQRFARRPKPCHFPGVFDHRWPHDAPWTTEPHSQGLCPHFAWAQEIASCNTRSAADVSCHMYATFVRPIRPALSWSGVPWLRPNSIKLRYPSEATPISPMRQGRASPDLSAGAPST